MNLDLKKLPVVVNSKSFKFNQGTRFWKSLKDSTVINEADSIASVDINPISPYNILSCTGNKCLLYDGITFNLSRTYTSQKSILAASYRSDGRLFSLASNDGYVQIFDENSTKTHSLRGFRASSSPTRVSVFSGNNMNLFTGSDDGMLKFWDFSTSNLLNGKQIHRDRIKSGSIITSQPNLFLAASYDGKISLSDMRIKDCAVGIFEFSSPVEHILTHPNGMTFMACGENSIKMYDLTQSKLLNNLTFHVKTITCLRFSHCLKYLHSSSLDAVINTYNPSNFDIIHSQKYTDPIITFSISENNKTVASALHDTIKKHGILFIKSVTNKRSAEQSSLPDEELFDEIKPKRYFHQDIDVTVIDSFKKYKKTKFEPYEKYINKFEHKKALQYVLNPENDVSQAKIIQVLRELLRRDCLIRSMKGLTVQDAIWLIEFIARHISFKENINFLLKVTEIFLDNRHKFTTLEENLSQDPDGRNRIDSSLLKLRNSFSRHLDFISKGFETLGMIDLITLPSRLQQHQTSKS